MGVSRQSLEKLRNALNPLDIIRESVPTLKQSGPRWRGLCPFHNERTPSFFFMPEKGLWHCFGGCQEGGDVFKFVMRLENLTFPEALRTLAQRAGVPLEWEGSTDASSKQSQERERLIQLLSDAASFYQDALRSSAEAEPARRHLAKRKIKPDTVTSFQMGYAPRGGGFLDGVLRKGVPVEDLTKAGLAVRSERTGRYQDPMQGRLVFPILDAYGRVVAFGGRILEDESLGPKYLNSPETPVYTKGRHLFGLYQGRGALREKGQALLVEGYMDVVGCHQAGVTNAVAPLGTAFTQEQGQLLKRYVQEVILLYDPDAAGVRASGRSADVLLAADLFVRVGSVPGELDPDEFLLQRGAPALEEVIKKSVDVVDFWLEQLSKETKPFDPLHEKVRRAGELLDLIRGVPNEMLRDEWVKKTARKLSLDEAALKRELHKRGVVERTSAAPRAPSPSGPPASSPGAKAPARVRSAEEEILQILSAHPEAWPAEPLRLEQFLDLRCRAIVQRLETQRRERGAVDVAALTTDLNDEDTRWLSSLLVEEKIFENPAEALEKGLRRLEALTAERERRALEKDVLQMLEGKIRRDETVIARYQSLTRQIKGREKAMEIGTNSL